MAASSTPTGSSSDTKPTMQDRIDTEQEANPLSHTWIFAAEVAIDHKTAKRGSFRGSIRTEAGMRVDALETYCRGCRRPFDEVADADCSAKIDNTHLIGGDPGVRAKRIVRKPQGVIHRAVIDRRGMGGYSVHAGR